MGNSDIFVGIVIGFVLGISIANFLVRALAPAPEKGVLYTYDDNGRLVAILPASASS